MFEVDGLCMELLNNGSSAELIIHTPKYGTYRYIIYFGDNKFTTIINKESRANVDKFIHPVNGSKSPNFDEELKTILHKLIF
jgi:hypothetical protein